MRADPEPSPISVKCVPHPRDLGAAVLLLLQCIYMREVLCSALHRGPGPGTRNLDPDLTMAAGTSHALDLSDFEHVMLCSLRVPSVLPLGTVRLAPWCWFYVQVASEDDSPTAVGPSQDPCTGLCGQDLAQAIPSGHLSGYRSHVTAWVRPR